MPAPVSEVEELNPMEDAVSFVPWREGLRPSFLESWKHGEEQSEHVTIVGRTGQGKTSLALDMIAGRLQTISRSRCLILANKKQDATLQTLIDRGVAAHIRRWKDLSYEHRVKRLVVLWPPLGKASTSAAKNRPEFVEALDGIMAEGDWTVFVDDAWYWVEHLRLGHLLDEFWNGARSADISLVFGSTRPVWITRSATSQHSWSVAFPMGDRQDRLRMAEVMGDRDIAPVIEGLGPHEFLLKRTTSGQGFISDLHT